MTRHEIFFAARELVSDLLSDVQKSKNREEHIRLSQRASQAERLLHALQVLEDDGK